MLPNGWPASEISYRRGSPLANQSPQAGCQVFSHRTVLSPDEIQRADRFYFDTDRTVHHCTRNNEYNSRVLILDTAAGPGLCYCAKGKPTLLPNPLKLDLRFNLSHSRDFCPSGCG